MDQFLGPVCRARGAAVEVLRRYAQHTIEVLPGAGVGRQWRRRLSRPILE